MVELLEFQTEDGRSPFGLWFAALDAAAAAKVAVALTRMSHGNFSNVEPVGSGVSEYKINWGAGISNLLWQGRRSDRDPVVRRNEEAAGIGHSESEGPLGRLQTPQEILTRNAWC